ncbi:hypothetical protein ACXYTJ_02210 [Gilvimarinus sp. F26214L]|uniref:hypothetical protein n=1 Tax=Gilvimarinus sp. DZF01 TaxID=3461371 RepID=UPI0040463EB2
MKVVATDSDYDPIASGAEKVLERTKALPDNVFKKTLKFFLFITFDELFMPLFFNNLKRYLLNIGENSFWLTAIEPDPKLYFGAHFDFYGAIEFSCSDTEDEYLSALNNYPADSPADAFAHNANLLMYFSSKYGWAIYGDRNADIAICAFADRRQMELFESIYGSDLLAGVKAAAAYAYGATGERDLEAELCGSYSAD